MNNEKYYCPFCNSELGLIKTERQTDYDAVEISKWQFYKCTNCMTIVKNKIW